MDPTGNILSYVLKKLHDLITKEATLHGNALEDLEWVQRELRMMAFLTMNIQDAGITEWIEIVRKLAFHAEDVIDNWSLHVGDATRKSFLSAFTSRPNLSTELTQLRESVAELCRYIPDTRTSFGTADRTEELLQFRRLMSAPNVEDRDVVSLDDHVNVVTDLLARGGSRRYVVSIVGMGGIGKTTLAKKVYNNLSSSFDFTAWLDVSPNYSIPDQLRKIAGEILELFHIDEQVTSQEAIMVNLREFTGYKKYLIVLDDVWHSQVLDMLDNNLPDPNNGSRIIITTRKKEVARCANPSMLPHELSALGEEASRVLFTKKVFPNEENPEQCCTKELASLREQIVKQCGGIPLAIIVVGELLSRKEKTPREWSKVAEEIEWEQEGKQC